MKCQLALSSQTLLWVLLSVKKVTETESFPIPSSSIGSGRDHFFSPTLRTAVVVDTETLDADVAVAVDDTNARSMFGTKAYWDDVYMGRGDFPADCYSWYYGWEVLRKVVEEYVPDKDNVRMLVPGIGNDSIMLDLFKAGYGRQGGCLIGQDYSEHAVERQVELLSFDQIECNVDNDNVYVVQGDVTQLPQEWTNTFDVILEKGLLDAVYLSSGGGFTDSTDDSDDDTSNVEAAVQNLHRVLRPNGLLISVSGVVPNELRRNVLFCTQSEDTKRKSGGAWTWLQDGSNDWRKAGCYVFQKLQR